MTVSKRIRQVHQQLSQLTGTIDDKTIRHKLDMLIEELNQIADDANPGATKTSANKAPELKNGCYIFTDQKGFYCPACFDRDGTRAVITRINSKLRICSVCRTSIK